MDEIEIRVEAGSAPLAEVASVALAEALETIPDFQLHQKGSADSAVRTRLTGLELLATFATSAAATQLAMAVRDAVKGRRVDVVLKRKDGNQLRIQASGLVSIKTILGFLKTHTTDLPESENK